MNIEPHPHSQYCWLGADIIPMHSVSQDNPQKHPFTSTHCDGKLAYRPLPIPLNCFLSRLIRQATRFTIPDNPGYPAPLAKTSASLIAKLLPTSLSTTAPDLSYLHNTTTLAPLFRRRIEYFTIA